MNKKLLFGIMSLAAFSACTDNDFESQNVLQEASPVQFEVINDALTRASMNGNTIVWNANDGDLFTLYHGANAGATTGYENATYTANAQEGGTATLSTPSMIKQGSAIMVWPVDTAFRITADKDLTLKIPAKLENVENNIPYVSDLINIKAYNAKAPYNTAGKDRKYPVFMRPMASQLTINADYVGTDKTIATLYEGGTAGLTGEDAIEPINVTSVDLLTETSGATQFTTEIPLKFEGTNTSWNKVANNSWSHVTKFDIDNITTGGKTNKLTTTVINGNESCKFLILPQAEMSTNGQGVSNGGIVVNTRYGRVVIAKPNTVTYDYANYGYYPTATGAVTKYTTAEYGKAWYRYIQSEKTLAADGETKATSKTGTLGYKTTANVEMGLKQTINGFSTYTAQSGVVDGEPVGVAATRYVEVRLNHLDMSDLHVKNDKQLRDVVRVWNKLGLEKVTVLLDGDGKKEFEITQKTIEVINKLNKRSGANLQFTVMPCQVSGEKCEKVVITGSDYKQDIQDIDFIVNNNGSKVEVELKNEGDAKPWKWNGSVKVLEDAVSKIVNKGTMENAANATLKTIKHTNPTTIQQNNVPFENARGAKWNITGSTVLYVQFNVTNYGKVTISKGAQYRQDGRDIQSKFTNDATNKPTRFGGNDAYVGTVENYGVFATVSESDIYNYGLIEHADVDAKTYITKNQTDAADFTNAFNSSSNKIGMINLPYSNKDEDNVSISAALDQGFVSVTVNGEVSGALDASVVGSKVNYVIVKSGITEIKAVSSQVKYLEINQPGTELAWNVSTATSYTGLMVLSDVNIKLETAITADVTYLGTGNMYVGGTFNYSGTVWNGYYGDTTSKKATQYITY